jgi:hypothetical protein
MSDTYLAGLLAELEHCRQTRNPRGRQVEAELERLGHKPAPAGAGEPTETAVPTQPTETAVPRRRPRSSGKES